MGLLMELGTKSYQHPPSLLSIQKFQVHAVLICPTLQRMAPYGTRIVGIMRLTFSSWTNRKQYISIFDRISYFLSYSCYSVGVGFSYADYGRTVETTEDAAKNVHAFITIFFETFTQFAGRPIHLSGESYGVRILTLMTLGALF